MPSEQSWGICAAFELLEVMEADTGRSGVRQLATTDQSYRHTGLGLTA